MEWGNDYNTSEAPVEVRGQVSDLGYYEQANVFSLLRLDIRLLFSASRPRVEFEPLGDAEPPATRPGPWLAACRGVSGHSKPWSVMRSGSEVSTWRAGTARILEQDDPRDRQRLIGRGNLARRLCVRASRAMGTSPLTVRIDLDTR